MTVACQPLIQRSLIGLTAHLAVVCPEVYVAAVERNDSLTGRFVQAVRWDFVPEFWQRVAIARALYDEPDLLIMDEATSALDTVTERAIQETVRALHGEVTTITIAHRISTIADCDKIFLIEDGMLATSGSYDHLLDNSPVFRELAAQKAMPAKTPDTETPLFVGNG